jgi:hypothetical protein
LNFYFLKIIRYQNHKIEYNFYWRDSFNKKSFIFFKVYLFIYFIFYVISNENKEPKQIINKTIIIKFIIYKQNSHAFGVYFSIIFLMRSKNKKTKTKISCLYLFIKYFLLLIQIISTLNNNNNNYNYYYIMINIINIS